MNHSLGKNGDKNQSKTRALDNDLFLNTNFIEKIKIIALLFVS